MFSIKIKKHNRIFRFIFFLFMGMYCVSCGYQVKNSENVAEFQREGFINSNTYQIIITSQPDRDIAGHVNQRDSAYINAKKNLPETVLNNLAIYCVEKKLSGKTDSIKISRDSESILKQKLHKFVKYGRIIFEYHNENNSAVIGYRIEKNGLKYELESTPVDIK